MSKERTKSVLVEASEIIHGDREKTYGHPSVNLQLIARYWQVYLDRKPYDQVLSVQDVCQMMVLLKLARLQNQPDHRDSLVDSVGYLGLIERCKEEFEPF